MDIKYIQHRVDMKEKALKDLDTYLGVNHTLFSFDNRRVLENILEKTVIAIKNGATKKDIEKTFVKYISSYQPDKTHG